MSYYKDDHKKAKALCNLQDKLDKMVKEMRYLEDLDRDLTAEEDARFLKLESDVKELNAYMDNIFLGDE